MNLFLVPFFEFPAGYFKCLGLFSRLDHFMYRTFPSLTQSLMSVAPKDILFLRMSPVSNILCYLVTLKSMLVRVSVALAPGFPFFGRKPRTPLQMTERKCLIKAENLVVNLYARTTSVWKFSWVLVVHFTPKWFLVFGSWGIAHG